MFPVEVFLSEKLSVRNFSMKILALVLLVCQNVLANNLEVTIRQGTLVGIEKENKMNKETYYAFYGIPYAKPPLEEKRFKSPEEPVPWNGVLNATQEGNACMSYNIITKLAEGDEDCLNLNVFTRKKPQELKNSPKPVMVWIHGGGFIVGPERPSQYAPDILMLQDIILVTINYRLNIFGFLSVQTDNVPGNAGLKDQVMALKWVQENIKEFGGDPNDVTIFGESAGAASVHYLLLSPSAKGLFHRAIAQSGTAINPWASTTRILETATKIGQVFNCSTKNSYELVDCLQQKKAKELVAYQFNIMSLKSDKFLTNLNIPCVEPKGTKNAFLTDYPRKLMDEGKFNDVPLMLGVLRYETLLLSLFFRDGAIPKSVRELVVEQLNKKPELLLPRDLVFDKPEDAKRVGNKMKKFYFGDQPVCDKTEDNLINATTDTWFALGTYETAMLYSKFAKSPVYLYYFTLETEFGEAEKQIQINKTGPYHTDDLKYFFYVWQKKIQIKPEEREKISQINKLWLNFAKFGNPTPEGNDLGVTWEPFTTEKDSYLEIDKEFTMKLNFEKERMDFWKKLTQEENLKYY